MLLVDGPLEQTHLALTAQDVSVPIVVACDRLGCLATHVTIHEYRADGTWVRSYTNLELTG